MKLDPRRFAFAAPLAFLAAAAPAQVICMTAVLDGAQETPPVPTSAIGTAYCIVDRNANTLSYALCFDGLSSAEQLAHIHGFSAPGTPSGIKLNLALGNFKQGVWNYAEADEVNIVAGLCYFNIHSMAFGGGEIRGQIERSSAPATLVAIADAAQVVPPTASLGKGVGWFEFDTLANTITYDFTMNGLSAAEDACHIHGFVPPGTSTASIKFSLPLGNHKSGVLVYPQAQEANYLAGLSYINVHIAPASDDEIRGQIVPAATNPSVYCTSKTNSQGCAAQIASSGSPSLTGADDFHVTCTQVLNNKAGIMYWGFAPKSAPFAGGTQCVQSPVIRTPVQNSLGNPPPEDCWGTYDVFFSHAYMAAQSLSAGQLIHCEYWYRDPADPATVSLSNALMAEITP